MTGWGDISNKYSHGGGVKKIPHSINPQLVSRYQEKLYNIVDILLSGLHLKEYIVKRNKYQDNTEQIEVIEESLRNILYKRAAQNLSNLELHG